jgi:tetratricopeptide (TPR) repeat protein
VPTNLKKRMIPFLAVAIGLCSAPAVQAQTRSGLAGPYLAAGAASKNHDYRPATSYFIRALTADPKNPALMENAILGLLAIGDAPRALPIARQVDATKSVSQAANLLILADLAKRDDFKGLLAELDGGRDAAPLVAGLLRAWALLGDGNMSDASAAFDAVAEAEGQQSFGLYHKALALASVGDFEGADAIFSGETGGVLRMTRRGVLAHAEVLSQLERNPDAIELINKAFGPDPDPSLAAMRDKLAAGETLPFDIISGPVDGVAEVFYTVAGALTGEVEGGYPLAYARLGEYLRPGHVDAILLIAGILEGQGQIELATEAYNQIPKDDPAFHIAEMGRADALVKAERTDETIAVLEGLTISNPDLPTVWISLGDTLRREERYAEAAAAYDSALGLFDAPAPEQWVIYYARGIAFEREKKWTEAEKDLRTALELSPDQPQVLNYLGYSYLEMNQNLDEALGMIEKAVAARPGDGYITDSLGWGLYRLGRYDEAVVQMEKAVELMPVDSVVNDHLGDVYWAVGRHLEAEFQWRRALSFEPETEQEATRLRAKLDVGLDAVLKDEGAKPLAVTQNGSN